MTPIATPKQATGPALIRWQGFLGAMRQRPVLASVILLLSVGLIGSAGWLIVFPQLAARYHLRKALQAADGYDLGVARSHLNDCLQHWPGHGEAHFQLARVCRRLSDFEAARKHLQEAKRCDWDTDDIELEYKLINAQTGAIRYAEQGLLAYIGVGHRDEIYVLETLVQAYLEGNFLDDAHRLAQYWIDRYPDMWRPQLLRGLILEKGHTFPHAIEQYEKLLARWPDQPHANLQLARIFLRAKLYDRGLAHFEAVRKTWPESTESLVGMAACQRELHGPDAARPLLEQALAVNPYHAGALRLRGKMFLNDEDNPEQAVVLLKKSDALVPNDLDTVGALSLALRRLNRDDEAKAYSDKSQALEREFHKLDALIHQIIATDQEKRTKPEAKMRNAQLRYEAGMSLMSVGREREGFIWLQSALQENPEHMACLKAVNEYMTRAGKKQTSPGAASDAAPARKS
jgi:tetratricopeptide (TPR) repeat protein